MKQGQVSRRDFVKTTAAVSAGIMASGLVVPTARAAGSDVLKVGLIGCGGRGVGAAKNCMEADPSVRICAVGDLFPDKAKDACNHLKKHPQATVSPDKVFHGFDNYKKVIDSGVDMVILATPPGFRPGHLKYAVEAGKHVFMEKPVAVDPVGIRTVLAAADLAKSKNLAIVAGTQRRHAASYIETIKRIQDGEIGELVGGQFYWMSDGVWMRPRKPGMSDMEYQCHNWYYFVWLCGDQICEQHVHNLDVMCWAFGAHPTRCMAVGGRQSRTGKDYGHIYDHITTEFEFANGARCTSWGAHIKGGSSRVGERIVGTKGSSNGNGMIFGPDGKKVIWQFAGDEISPYVQEHKDLIASIRSGKPLNEGRQVAESTLCAIMGRMSAYTGKELGWNWAMNSSKLDTFPKKLEFGPLPVEPVAIPGVTPLI